MRLCNLDEIKIGVDRQYENCHGYSGNKKAIYREAILAVKSILHSAKPVDAVEVVRCRECGHGTLCTDGYVRCQYPSGKVILMKSSDFCSYGERED